MTRLLAAAAAGCAAVLGLLAGCTTSSVPLQSVAWDAEPVAGGAALVAREAGLPVLRLACGGGSFEVQALGLAPAGGDVLAVGTADDTIRLAVDPSAGGPGVTARGPVPVPLLTEMMSDGALSVAYGGQQLGPLVLPASAADPFVGACLSQ